MHEAAGISFKVLETGIAQLVYRRAKAWTAGVRFPAGSKRFSLPTTQGLDRGPTEPPIQLVQRELSLRSNRAGREADHSFHLVPKSRMTELHLHSPICLHGMLLN
jgi:hypothetical protein